jgi:hypothetical protein
VTAAYRQACALVGVGWHAQAAAVLRTALAETPGDAELLTLLAFTLRKQDEPAAALRACEAALAADPNLAEAHLEHAESCRSGRPRPCRRVEQGEGARGWCDGRVQPARAAAGIDAGLGVGPRLTNNWMSLPRTRAVLSAFLTGSGSPMCSGMAVAL